MSIFSKIPVPRVKRTPHALNNSHKFSTQFGYETPVRMEKVVPGDIIAYQHAHRIDFAPLSTKCLQEFRVKQEAFYVPTRILWKDFEQFFADIDGESDLIHPYFTIRDLKSNLESLCSYYNINVTPSDFSFYFLCGKSLLRKLYGRLWSVEPDDGGNNTNLGLRLDALRVFAYYRVMAEYYLDENLQSDFIDLLSVDTFRGYWQGSSGNMSQWLAATLINIACLHAVGYRADSSEFQDGSFGSLIGNQWNRYSYYFYGFILRNYPKDYFTSALPWKQKGASVMIPQLSGQDVNAYIQNDQDAVYPVSPNFLTGTLSVQKTNVQGDDVPAGYTQVNLAQGLINSINASASMNQQYLKLRTATGQGVTSIEDFRTAYQLQQWLERNARGGTRYKEQILSHFGVKTKDSRLDRPEFLMGTTDVISHGDVFTTFQNEAGDGVPAESITRLSGAGRSSTVQYKVTEHGYFIALFCIYPKASYNLGVYRQAMELDKFDYFWPEFEHLGEQEIFPTEVDIRHQGDVPFGYTPRYAQYKMSLNDVSGEFEESLATFTDSRIWANPANLNSKFIQIDAPFNNLNRIFNVVTSNYDKIYVDIYNNLFMLRPMDYYGIPRLVL